LLIVSSKLLTYAVNVIETALLTLEADSASALCGCYERTLEA